MRGIIHLFSLVALASTAVLSSPITGCLSELCGSTDLFESSPSPVDPAAPIANVDIPTRSLPDHGVEQLTNAERFARGLPPKKPKLIRGSPLRRTQASPAPVNTLRGTLRVDRADGGGTLGYLSKNPFSGAQTRYQDISNAVTVSFKFDPSGTSGPASDFTFESVATPQSPGAGFTNDYQILGLVQGRDSTSPDIAHGNFNYLYIAGTTQTSPGATPQSVANSYSDTTKISRTAESEVWQYNSDTKEITVQWVNSDGVAASQTSIWTQGTALYAGGDSVAFASKYPSPVTLLKLIFVPA